MNQGLILTSQLLAFALFLQGLEIFSLCINSSMLKIWSFENLKRDLRIRFLFSEKSLRIIATFQILLALNALLSPHFLFFLGLFFTCLIVSIRFRGTFNGGSDMMTFVILTGTCVGWGLKPEWGLIYIAIHTFYSYFKAGIVKVIQKDWRTGRALPVFLQRSLYPDIQNLGVSLTHYKYVSLVLCWGAILFELGGISLLFIPKMTLIYFTMAVLFHLIVYRCFGLNRFFWIWISGWPSLFYVVTLL